MAAPRIIRATAPVPKYEQKEPSACGPAALRSVLLSYGKDVSEKRLSELAGTTKEKGTTPQGLVHAAEELGFKAKAFEESTFKQLDDLVMNQDLPVIVSWYSPRGYVEGHYSVVTKVDEKHVHIMDPQDGTNRALARDDFQALWFDFEIAKQLKGLHRRQMVVVKSPAKKTAGRPYSNSHDRMDYYRPHLKSDLSRELLDRINHGDLGRASGMIVRSVNGEVIRNTGADLDFTTGGNPGRYRYVPHGEIWVEMVLRPSDVTGVIVHEGVEAILMINFGLSYDDAHDIANEHEWQIRQGIEAGLIEVRSYADAVRIADERIRGQGSSTMPSISSSRRMT